MILKVKPPELAPCIPETITYLERESKGRGTEKLQRVREIHELYIYPSKILHQHLVKLVKFWGDTPAIRQIIFYQYLQKEPLIKEIILQYIYPNIKQGNYLWKSDEIELFLEFQGLNQTEQKKTRQYIEKLFHEVRFYTYKKGLKYIGYQRPTLEAVAYAFYAEYGDGFPEAKVYSLKNPPLKQIINQAIFPALFFINPRTLPLILEACRLKDYISLEARGGLNQYALIYQDLSGLVDYMTGGGA